MGIARREKVEMNTNYKAVLILFNIWVLAGCAALIVGTGAGVGTYTYLKGDLKRTYQVKFDKALGVCLSVLNDLDQPILKKTTDGEKTTIQTERKDGSPQTIIVSISNVDWTEVSVRTGVMGYWKKEVSQQFHEFIAERLKK